MEKSIFARSKWMLVMMSLCVLHTATAAAVVIGNPGISIDSLSSAQVSQVFLGKMGTLPDGTKVVIIDHQDGESIKDQFYEKVVGKSPSQLKAYWAKIIFTGEGVPPKAYPGDKAVKDQVSATPGAIGYVDSGSVDKTVKVLFEQK